MKDIMFSGLKFIKIDPNNQLKINEDKVEWNKVSRTSPCRFETIPDEEDKIMDMSYFKHSFTFQVNEIYNISDRNRHLFTLYKIVNKPGNMLSLYISEVINSNNKFRLVFFQRVDGKNVFVEKTDILEINKTYEIEIIRTNEYFTFILYSEDKETLTKNKGLDDDYKKVNICQGHNFNIAPNDYSSGYITDISFEHTKTPIPKGDIKEYEYDVFISYCRMSGSIYANHIRNCLSDLNLKVFLDIDEIPSVLDSFNDYWENKIKKALEKSNYFVLLMTPGYETRKMIQKEVAYADVIHTGKKIFCKWNRLPRERLYFEYEDEGQLKSINFNDLNYESFENKDDLFSKLYLLLHNEDIIPYNPRNPYLEK